MSKMIRQIEELASLGLQACAERDALQAELTALRAENARLVALMNTPQTADWFEGTRMEAAHQIDRWGSNHDEGKSPFDWFWLIGYLAQKAADAAVRGDDEKAEHHTISTAAVLLNWHRALSGESNAMRPGTQALTALARKGGV